MELSNMLKCEQGNNIASKGESSTLYSRSHICVIWVGTPFKRCLFEGILTVGLVPTFFEISNQVKYIHDFLRASRD